MSKKPLRLWLPAVLGCLVLWGTGLAEDFSPFIDPSVFDMDYQIFAPAELGEYGGGPKPNTGFYFTYDRLNWSVSRPEILSQDFDFDKGWGNRFELGFMTESDRGWRLNITRLDGPHQILRIGPDTIDGLVPITTNNIIFNSVSLDRVWRLPENKGGSYTEPFVGLAWMQVSDYWPRFVNLGEGDEVLSGFDFIKAENNILGGQVGVRWFHQQGRWVLSSEASFFGGYNWQFHDLASRTFEEGMFVGDARLDATFIITRKASLHVGVEAIHAPFGIGRIFADQFVSSEDLTLIGIGFGLSFNR